MKTQVASYETISRSVGGKKPPIKPGVPRTNEDRVVVRRIAHPSLNGSGDALVLAVADGVSRCPDGGGIANYLIHDRIEQDAIFVPGEISLDNQYRTYLKLIEAMFYKAFEKNKDMLMSATTLSTVLVERNVAHCYWVGDSPILFSRRSGKQYLTGDVIIPDSVAGALLDCFGSFSSFKMKYVGIPLEVNDIITVASDGIAHDFPLIGDAYERNGFSEAFIDEIVEEAYSYDYPDDISVVAARRIS